MENSARPQNWKRSVFIPIPKKGNAKKCSTAVAKSLQSCPTLCDPVDSSPPGSIVPGILQARTLEWVAISFSNAWKWKVKVKSLSHVRLFTTPWTAAYQAPPSMGFSRQEYWSGLPLPSLMTATNPYFFLMVNFVLKKEKNKDGRKERRKRERKEGRKEGWGEGVGRKSLPVLISREAKRNEGALSKLLENPAWGWWPPSGLEILVTHFCFSIHKNSKQYILYTITYIQLLLK